MRSTINHLIQLQELLLIRDEQRSLHGVRADVTKLDESVKSLSESLLPKAKVIFNRLSRRDPIVVSPMNDNKCSVCGMKLAIALVQSVKQCRDLTPCPSCARLLYDPMGAKWVAEPPKRSSGEQKSGIARFSDMSLMIPELEAETGEDAIRELAQIMQENRFVDDAGKLVQSALERESIYGTDIGHGLAFPHVRGVEGGGLALAFGISKKGLRWTEKSKAPVHFVFFTIIPTAVSMFYLKLLAGLSETFTKEAARKQSLEAVTAEDLWKVLVKVTAKTIR